MNEINKKYCILIVDDEISGISTLTGILDPYYEILSLQESREAESTAERKQPDLILLDIFMPEIDGFEVITRLKLNEKTKHIPVIIITGFDNRKAEENGLMLGAVDYIAKPFHPAIVKLRIENQIKILENSIKSKS